MLMRIKYLWPAPSAGKRVRSKQVLVSDVIYRTHSDFQGADEFTFLKTELELF